MGIRWATKCGCAFLCLVTMNLLPSVAAGDVEASPAPSMQGSASSSAMRAPPSREIDPKVILYEDVPKYPNGKRSYGTVSWRRQVASYDGEKPKVSVVAEIDIPERFKVNVSFRRNNNTAVWASHIVDITIIELPGFPGGEIVKMPGVLMKTAERTRGVPLAGIAEKLAANSFRIQLSPIDADIKHNTALLKNWSWFDIPLVYGNEMRAILAVGKGDAGERIMRTALSNKEL